MTSIIKHSSLSIVAAAVAMAASFASSTALADSVAATHGNPIIASQASCLSMNNGSLKNTCSVEVAVEFALPVRTSGNKCVKVFYPTGTRVENKVFSVSGNLIYHAGLAPYYYPTYSASCGTPINTDWTLNTTVFLKPGQRVDSISWDG